MISEIRDWLKRNQIYLTLVVILLSVATIAVMVVSHQLSSELTKKEKYPILDFELTTSSTDDHLLISNLGGPISEFKQNCVVFLEIKYRKGVNKTEIAKIPFCSYYDGYVPFNNPTGSLVRLENLDGNYGKISQTLWEFSTEGNIFRCDIKRYIKILYSDIWGESHCEFYFVDAFESGDLSEIEGEEIFKEYKGKFSFCLRESEISVELIYEKWLGIIEMEK